MKPFETARATQLLYVTREQFDSDLELYRRHGVVIDTPEIFVMARMVCKEATFGQILDPRFHFNPSDCDTWFVYLLAGRLAALWELIPFPLTCACWIRPKTKTLYFYPVAAIRAKMEAFHGRRRF